MQDELSLKKKAEEALKKSAVYGEDFNLDDYEIASKGTKITKDLTSLSDEDQKTLLNVGIVPNEENRSGTFVMLNNAVSHTSVKQDDAVELMSIQDALKRYDWVKDYSWKLVKPDADKYTATTYLQNADGYFIRAPAGKNLQCLYRHACSLGQRMFLRQCIIS